MSAGKPVFLSNYGSLPEVGGKYAFYFDSFNTENMISVLNEKLKSYNEEKSHYIDLIKRYANNFSWKSCITQYLHIYYELLQ